MRGVFCGVLLSVPIWAVLAGLAYLVYLALAS